MLQVSKMAHILKKTRRYLEDQTEMEENFYKNYETLLQETLETIRKYAASKIHFLLRIVKSQNLT